MFKKPVHLLKNLVKSMTQTEPTHDSTNISPHGRMTLELKAPNVPVTLQVFNPGGTSTFSVTSTLIIGPTEVALVDTQFHKTDAEALVQLIKASGKKLTLVYISNEHPDCYFGSEVIQKEFPECPFYAVKHTIDEIVRNKDAMLAHWSSTLADNAPKNIIVPERLKNHGFTVDSYEVKIMEPTPSKSYCWLPSMNAILGGFSVFGNNSHLWLADDSTTESRLAWYQTLMSINNHYPDSVVPSHFLPGTTFDMHNVEFSEQYLSVVERNLPLTDNAAEFVSVMEDMYPELQAKFNLVFSAKVLKNEMDWPKPN